MADRSTASVFRENSNGANGLTFDHQGRLLTCERDRVTRTEKDGSITVLASKYRRQDAAESQTTSSMPSTAASISSCSGRGTHLRHRPWMRPAVYQITRNGQVADCFADCERPNGVALAPNQQQLFVADSGQTQRPDIRHQRATAVPGAARVFCELKADAGRSGWVQNR